MTSYFARSASFQGIANLPELLQTKGIKGREAGQPISGQALSSADQRLEIQEDALRAAGCTVIRAEKVSGGKITGRDQLATVLDFIQSGDVLVVTKIDRLARSIGDLSDIVRAIEGKGASLRVLNAHIDTAAAAGKAFLGMLGVFAEFETNIRKERQLEGIAKAKAAGLPQSSQMLSGG